MGQVTSCSAQRKLVIHSVEKNFYNSVIEFGSPYKVIRLIKMCLNETYSKVCTSKHLFRVL
jgi:hypothetical protein